MKDQRRIKKEIDCLQVSKGIWWKGLNWKGKVMSWRGKVKCGTHGSYAAKRTKDKKENSLFAKNKGDTWRNLDTDNRNLSV